jgi:hypothetical protein
MYVNTSSYCSFFEKMGLATFGAIFSKLIWSLCLQCRGLSFSQCMGPKSLKVYFVFQPFADMYIHFCQVTCSYAICIWKVYCQESYLRQNFHIHTYLTDIETWEKFVFCISYFKRWRKNAYICFHRTDDGYSAHEGSYKTCRCETVCPVT